MKRASYTKFLGVLLDENLSWKEHLKYTKNKIAKSTGLMYKAKHFLDKDSLMVLDLGLDDKAIRAFCMSLLKQFVY